MTADGGAPTRLPAPQTVEAYLAGAVPVAVPVPGTPAALLVIDGAAEQIAIEVAWDGEAVPDLVEYEYLHARVVTRDGIAWARLEISGRAHLLDGYPLLSAIVDDIQHVGTSFGTAVRAVLARYRDMLAASEKLTSEREIGLYGELLVFERLLGIAGVDPVAAWRGSAGEEHDFGLIDGDLEVKTTTTEAPAHWISGLRQLVPSTQRPLWLISIQLTGAGAEEGATLGDVVRRVRAQARAGDVLEGKLSESGWRDAQAAHYVRRLRLRVPFAIYAVDDAFPALTPSRLAATGLPAERFPRVTYQIDLTGLPSPTVAQLPPVLAALLEGDMKP